jgi:outer membrane receptor protein involved in Fe transport
MPYYNDSGSFKGYKHIGDSINQGVELAADGMLTDWMGYRAGFTWIDAEWDSAQTKVRLHGATPAADSYSVEDISGKKVYRVPEYEYQIGFDFYPVDKLILSIDFHGFGKQYIDALNRYENKPVTLVDSKISYKPKDNWEVYLLGSNLFNIDYESIFNTTGLRNSDGSANHSYYPQDGRYIEIGTAIKF